MKLLFGIITAFILVVIFFSCNNVTGLPSDNGNFTMVTSSQPTDGGTVTPVSGDFEPDSEVELKAVPEDGHQFEHWMGDLSGSDNPAMLIMDADRNVTAIFSRIESEGSDENDEGDNDGTGGDDGSGDTGDNDGSGDSGDGETDDGNSGNGGGTDDTGDHGAGDDGDSGDNTDNGDDNGDDGDDDSGQEGDIMDISIIDISAPTSAERGERVTVYVTVKNLGTMNMREEIEVELINQTDDKDIGEQEIKRGIDVNESAILTFIWKTPRGKSSGVYTLLATHDYDEDDNEGTLWQSIQIEISDD
ncbi:MAG: CARDB domain-containing protein [Balneolaceae bacterium]